MKSKSSTPFNIRRAFAIVSLGCPKNAVDAAGIEQVLLGAGYTPVRRPERADVLVVNTCGFIQAATDESLAELRSLARRKRPGQLLVAAGCLAEKWSEKLVEAVPGIDAVLGTRRWGEVAAVLRERESGIERPSRTGDGEPEPSVPRAEAGPSAYLKIADGCDAACAFCVIPAIKGPYRSRPPERILAEARQLAGGGVKELVLVAQDTTSYGRDRGDRGALARLLRALLAEAPGVPWLRLMYAYPTHLDAELLDLMAAEPRLLPYLDLPLQHAHRAVLRRMRRPPADPRGVVERIRAAVPGVALRSTFIVGFPGETDEEFASLLAFLEESELDRVGVFPYSAEEGTPAAGLPGQVPEEVKACRLDAALRAQQGVSLRINRRLVGQVLEVLVEGEAEPEVNGRAGRHRRQRLGCGRSYRDAPEVDGLVLFSGRARPGEMTRVRVTEALPYDLVGERLQ